MDAIKFTLRGNTAFFKKPDVNSNVYFTYGCIHKVALLGIFGAILGYSGYNKIKDKKDITVYPEFYERLKNLKISIVPRNKGGYITKKVQIFNNSVGYASKEQGGNLIVKEQWLENPIWDIYFIIDCKESENLKEKMLNSECTYMPYLGKNDHPASVEDVVLIKDIEEASCIKSIDSIFIKDSVVLEEEDYFSFEEDVYVEPIWKYDEKLPMTLDEITNKYEFESFIATNRKVESVKESNIYNICGKNLFFI